MGKRFTGWCDIPLTEHGISDAKDSGTLMQERGMKFDVAFTSNLERAWKTCETALLYSDQSNIEVIKSWKLNERHYGALQGHLKNCPKLIESFGEPTLIEWRKSYDHAPPSLRDPGIADKLDQESVRLGNSRMDPRYFSHDGANVVDCDVFPATESLKDCEKRAFSYWTDAIAPRVRAGKRVLIVAHANTIRALVKAVDRIEDNMIRHLKIPNGIPLVYTLDANLEPIIDSTDDLGFQAKYLISPHNHEKVRALGGALLLLCLCTHRVCSFLSFFLFFDASLLPPPILNLVLSLSPPHISSTQYPTPPKPNPNPNCNWKR